MWCRDTIPLHTEAEERVVSMWVGLVVGTRGLLSDCVRCFPREHEASSLAWWWRRVGAGAECRRSEE